MRASTAMALESCYANSHLVGFLAFTAVHTYTGSRRETGLDVLAVGYGAMFFIVLGKDRWYRGVIIAHCILLEYRNARDVIF